MGTGLDEVVLYATGSSARQTVMTERRPGDTVVMAIVDGWAVAGEVKYHKDEEARSVQPQLADDRIGGRCGFG